jgi:hypothetical protein
MQHRRVLHKQEQHGHDTDAAACCQSKETCHMTRLIHVVCKMLMMRDDYATPYTTKCAISLGAITPHYSAGFS